MAPALPRVHIFKCSDGEPKLALMTAITHMRQLGSREQRLLLDESGSLPRMKGTTVRFRAPKVGDSVEFKPATMGTYWIRLNGRKGVRGNRIG